MKLVTFTTGSGTPLIGAMLPGEQSLSDFTTASAAPHFQDMLALIDGGDAALEEARTLLLDPGRERRLADVTLLAPVPVPRQMYDALCFEKHLVQAKANVHHVFGGEPVSTLDGAAPAIYRERPVYYKPNRFSVVGTGVDVVCPRYSNWLDYELEFGVFLSRNGKDIPKDQARSHIFGYCIYNDVSARDRQLIEMQGMLGPSKGKDFDTGNVMGPWLVTADEITDPYNLTMQVTINGELRSTGTSADMMHSFEDIISYASADETLHAGTFWGSGTVGGGCGLEHASRLQHGDIVELEVSGLGRMRNRIVMQS